MFNLERVCENAKNSLKSINELKEKDINKILVDASCFVIKDANYLKKQNRIDIEKAKENGKSDSFIDRLKLTDNVIESIANGLKEVSFLKSPVDKTIYKYKNKCQGIKITEKNVPFGVIGIIYESRPNVTADAFALCFKTKNAVILKGGSDAINSNLAIAKSIRKALKQNNVDENAITVISDTSRKTTVKFMQMKKYVDLLIPRGSAKLIKTAVENSTIPIIETGSGNCHVYVDESANVDMAVKVIVNAKTQRYSVCNACESLVVHNKILKKVMPKVAKALTEKGVEIRCDERALKYVKNGTKATNEDFYTEYVDAIISVKTVDSIDEAIKHINEHSTHHSESIITNDKKNAKKFQKEIDSSSVYVNASTRFTDGFIFGFGAEIGISTQKMHARGPMGLDALCTKKFFITGKGAIRK